MKRKFILHFFAAWSLLIFALSANAQTQLFYNGSENNTAIYWRIPSLVRLNDGTLWAFTDKRYGEATDLGGNGGDTEHKIEIYGRKSYDNGKSWTNAAVVLQSNAQASGDQEYLYAFGDAATVVDRESGRVLMMAASGKKGVGSKTDGRPFVTRSVFDMGKWSTSNVSDQFYGASNGTHLFVSSGRMVQSTRYKKDKYYRIYAGVCLYSKNASYVAYSDDFGATWHYLGGDQTVPVQDGDECKVEELPNGDILLVTRKRSGKAGRYVNVFKFSDIATAQGSWQTSVSTGENQTDGEAYAAANNGEILLVPARSKDGRQTYLLLLSVPTNNSGDRTGRSNVCIYWKELPTDYSDPKNYVSGWKKYQVNKGQYWGYTTMVLDKNGDVAFLSELSKFVGPISFISLPVSTITGGDYSYHVSAKGTYHSTSESTILKQPSISLNGGIYTSEQTVTINKAEGTTVYYTLDGSEPVVDAQPATSTHAKAQRRAQGTPVGTQVYSEPITLTSGATTLKAVAVDDYSGNVSPQVSASYYIASADNTTTTMENKTGTTVSIDFNSSIPLYSDAASGPDHSQQPYAYLRHKNAHLQLISSGSKALGDGSQVFTAINNNLQFTTDGNHYLSLYNTKIKWNPETYSPFSYFAVFAPKGARFLRFQIVLDKSSKNGAYLTRYKYGADGQTFVPVDSVQASSSQDVTFDRTLENGGNVLYFRINVQSTSKQNINLKSFKLTYANDDDIEAQIPNAKGNTSFHTGYVDLGTLKTNSNGYFSFSNSNLDDLQSVKAVRRDGSTLQNVTVDGTNCFMATSEDDYYFEAPVKFRIIGATVNLKRGTVTMGNYEPYTPSTAANNKEIIFKSSSAEQYLIINDQGRGKSTPDRNQATKFYMSYDASQGKYTIKTADNKYLYMTTADEQKGTIALSADPQYWGLSSNNKLFFILNRNKRYLICTLNTKDNVWVWGDSWNENNPDYPSIKSTPATYTAGGFKATVFNREGTGAATNGDVTVSESSATQTVTVNDMNNDALHIRLSDFTSGNAAFFNVQLRMLPLDPEVATLEAAAMIDGKVEGNTPVTSYNYEFNNGNTINVPVPSTTDGDKSIAMVFRNAKNEEQTLWYSTGNNQNNPRVKGGYSNVYLIGSTADTDNGLSITSPYPDARTAVDQAGTVSVNTTNIVELSNSGNTTGNTLQDNDVDKTNTGYKDVTMTLNNPTSSNGTTDDKTTFYLYSIDRPTYQIMPGDISYGKHVDFRNYTISVKPVKAETPQIDVIEIYKETMKGAQHKPSDAPLEADNNTLDKTHTYVGIKVSAKNNEGVTTSYGALNVEDIYKAMKEKLDVETYGFKGDPLRGVLYVDMSGLTTVTTNDQTSMNNYWKETADNCLFFMPKSFAGTGLRNVISKQDDGTYQAFGDVTVYDQQPFFSPYDFTTGTYMAKYEREGTMNGKVSKALVRDMSAVLPFDIRLDVDGHPYLNGEDQATSAITFRNITGSGEVTAVRKPQEGLEQDELTYAVDAQPETGGTATANTPYHVTVTKESEPGFTFNIPGAHFAKSGTVEETSADGNTTLTVTLDKLTHEKEGTWTGHGTYSGCAPQTAPNLWYFSQNLFWKSIQLKNYSTVNVRPFRAYYTTTANTGSHVKAFVIFDLSDIITTGVNGITTVPGTVGKVYTLDGQYVGNSLKDLAPGIYIHNGRKVMKR